MATLQCRIKYRPIGGLATTNHELVRSHYRDAPSSLVGWFLIAAAALFTLTWLRDIAPALLAGAKPTSATETGLPTNPVHVLDLAVFLPAVFATGVLLLRHRPLAYTTAPALLVFLTLTTLPALATPFIAAARGGLAQWALLAPLSLIAMLSLLTLVLYLRPRAAPDTSGIWGSSSPSSPPTTTDSPIAANRSPHRGHATASGTATLLSLVGEPGPRRTGRPSR